MHAICLSNRIVSKLIKIELFSVAKWSNHVCTERLRNLLLMLALWQCLSNNFITLAVGQKRADARDGAADGRSLYSNIQPCVTHTHTHKHQCLYVCMYACVRVLVRSFDALLWPINKLLPLLLLLLLLRLFFCVCQLWAKWYFLLLLLRFFSSSLTGWLVASWKLSIKKPIKRDVAAVWAEGTPMCHEGRQGVLGKVLIWLGQWMSV